MIFKPDDVKDRLRERPFRPVRIVTTTDQHYDIYHPDLVMVLQRFLMVGTASSDDPSLADSVTRVALVHVAELRDLPITSPPSNGASSGG